MFKIFKSYFAAGFGTVAGMLAATAFSGFVTGLLNSKTAENEIDPDIETEK